MNLVVDTHRGVFKYELNEFEESDKIKWLASLLEGSLKNLMESVYNEHRQKYVELKEYIEKYLSKPENYEEDRENWLKKKTHEQVFLQIKGKMYVREINYNCSNVEDLGIALMLIFANIYNQLLKIDEIKARNFKEWAVSEIGTTLGSSFWHTLESCILD